MKKISMIAMSAILLAGVAACSATDPASESDAVSTDSSVIAEDSAAEYVKGDY